jgi:UDP-N-acetylglucosamine 2-epimerase (non-hydrolysing)
MPVVSVIFGTRPEAIKLAPVVLALRRCTGLTCEVCVTAQHRQLLDQVLRVFEITPDLDLDLMRENQSLGRLTSQAVAALDGYLAERKPDLVLVQGDTTTVFCATLAAFYHRIPVGHVEAGLRTGDLSAPWPEEANRVLTSRLAALHFAPTEGARDNLLREGVPAGRIHVTGNTVVDALLMARERVRAAPPEVPGLPASAGSGPRRLVLVTCHRRESFGPGLESICRALAELAARFPGVDFVYPVHPNPNVRGPVDAALGRLPGGNVHLVNPLEYLPFVSLMDRCALLLTDSGGVQEEAPILGKPVLVLREVTERPEAVAAGAARLVGTDRQKIVAEVSRLLTDKRAYAEMAQVRHVYGDGHAAERIVEVCARLKTEG